MELPHAVPYAFRFRKESTALIVIDMQRDFLEPGGFGSIQCGDPEVFSSVRSIIPTVRQALEASRNLGLQVMHTREGHLPDLSDLPASKRLRQTNTPNGHHTVGIGGPGPMGRLLVRGECGHDIIDELRPLPGEVIIDKPGKGSFWNTGFHRALLARGITHLLLAGVTTECCVNTTAREAADRGFECCILTDCTSGFDAGLVTSANDTICAYDGLFGYVGTSTDLIRLAETQATVISVHEAAVEDLSILALSQIYHTGAATPVDIAHIVAERTSKHRSQNFNAWSHLKTPGMLLDAAKTLQDKFFSKPLPPLYGIPFTIDNHIGFGSTNSENKVVEALIDAGAILVGRTSESSLAVAARSVSFSLETGTLKNTNASGSLKSVVTLHPTPGTLAPDTDSVSIVAQSVEDARKIWLIADQARNEDDVFLRPQATINSWVWHVDFRGRRDGGFIFGVPKDWSERIGQTSASDSEESEKLCQAIAQLEAAGGRSLEIDWDVFEQAKHLSQNLLSLGSAECVSMKVVLNLQAEQKNLTRKAAKIFESADVLLDAACLCHSSEWHDGENSSLMNMLDLCGVTMDLGFAQKHQEHVCSTISLLGGTGREGMLFDIAHELESISQPKGEIKLSRREC